jgi:hypothetical protein
MTPSILGWIVLTRELSDYERWDEEEIEKRGRQLATEAVRIWIGSLSGRVKSGQWWSGQNRPTDVARNVVLLS